MGEEGRRRERGREKPAKAPLITEFTSLLPLLLDKKEKKRKKEGKKKEKRKKRRNVRTIEICQL